MKKSSPAKAGSKDIYLKWYEQMLLMRKFEERAGQLYGMQKIKGFCHLYIGQEAVAVGLQSAMTVGKETFVLAAGFPLWREIR